MTNLFMLMLDKPELLDYLSKKVLENNIEEIRRLASAGGDVIYIDDATSTCDMISTEQYERFSLPYMKQMVEAIHSFGQKAVLIYFGGIADRLEQIASIGADALLMETSMKNYVNDIAETAEKIGARINLYDCNINPIEVIQNGTVQELEAEMQRQFMAAQKAKGFIMSTGSPLTMDTPITRVQNYIKLAKTLK